MANTAVRLVVYESDEEEEEDKDKDATREKRKAEEDDAASRKKLPPLPQLFFDKFGPIISTISVSADGRTRSQPHVQGNWATTVYVQLEPRDTLSHLTSQLLSFPAAVTSQIHRFDSDECHLSLSRTHYIKEFMIQKLVDRINDELQQRSIGRLAIWATGVKAFENDEHTRRFLSVLVSSDSNKLMQLLSCVDTTLQSFDLPVFYKPAELHVSVAWTIDMTAWDSTIISSLNQHLNKIDEAKELFYVNSLIVKSGNRIFKLNLS